ncbi:CBS domain-containing protein [Saliterribacillus persicus]|uniref:CBS domain protein n=1 Tax=Saliterribacillus persicus TaxID=930114 RepID=A0A368X7U2_9BACI|nr:CBS domain-containing protein [Saliterribacillus persicus]RCW63759.1 CBS domain protein [Saliterribacillus persicus]
MKNNNYDNAIRFETAFNRIHDKLTVLANEKNEFVSFGEVLHKARHHHIVNYHYDLLKQCSKLRNALVHRKVKKDFYIAEPHLEIVLELEEICELLYQPPLALTIASSPVVKHYIDDTIPHILKSIEKYSYSQFPIYDKNGFCGLITEGGLAKWFAKNMQDKQVMLKNTTAAHVLACEKKHNVGFLSKTATIYDLEAIFEASLSNNQKLEAVILTEDGLSQERPMGIISAWDLVKIKPTTLSIISHI